MSRLVDVVMIALIAHSATYSSSDVTIRLQGDTYDHLEFSMCLNSSPVTAAVSCSRISTGALNCIRDISDITVSSITVLLCAGRNGGVYILTADSLEAAKL